MTEEVQSYIKTCLEHKDEPDKCFLVVFKRLDKRVLKLPNKCFIETILSPENGYEIIDIEELDEHDECMTNENVWRI